MKKMKKKKKKQKIQAKTIISEILQWLLILFLFVSLFVHYRSASEKNVEIISGEISNIYAQSPGYHAPYRIFFTISNRKCYYLSNTKGHVTVPEIKDFVDQLRELEKEHQTVTVWVIDHAEPFINLLFVGECERVAAIHTNDINIPVQYYNKKATFERIGLLFFLTVLLAFKIWYTVLCVQTRD